MGVTDLLNYVDEQKKLQSQTSAVAGAMNQAHGTNPDQYAKFKKLEQQTGMPALWMNDDPELAGEAQRKVDLDGAKFGMLAKQAPATSSWLAAGDNSRVGLDDIDSFIKIEGLFRGADTKDNRSAMRIAGPQDVQFTREFRNANFGKLTGQALTKALPNVAKNINETLLVVNELQKFNPFMAPVAIVQEMTGLKKASDDLLKSNMNYYKGVVEGAEKYKPQTRFERNFASAADSIAANLVTLPFGLAGRSAALASFAVSAPGQLEEYLDKGYSPTQAALFSMSNKAMEGLTEMIGVSRLYKGGNSLVKRGLQFLGGDLLGEEINTTYNFLMDKGLLNPELTMNDYVTQLVDTAAVTVMAGGAQGAIMQPFAMMSQEYADHQKAQQNKNFMLALGDTTKESKLHQRLPEAFQDLVQRIRQNGAIENVYIPAQQWNQYWQSANVDPVAAAADIVADGDKQFADALASGGDLVIPIEAYAANLAATDHHVPLTDHMRLSPGEATAFESAEWEQTAEEQKQQIISALTSSATERPSYLKVYDDIAGQLHGIGYDRATAQQYATLATARAKTRAERRGVDAWELYQESPLKITRPLPEGVQRKSVDMGLDPLLDRLRDGDIPAESDIFGPSLLQFVRERGVKDDRGDLRSMDVDAGRKPGQRNILRKDGMALDKLRESAEEAGYLPDESTIADLLDMIDQELRGTPKYSSTPVDQQAFDTKLALDELKMHLDQLGLDYAALNNEQIRNQLTQMSQDGLQNYGGGVQYNQSNQGADPTGSLRLAEIGPRSVDVVAAENGVSYAISGNQKQNDNTTSNVPEKLGGNVDGSGTIQEQLSIFFTEGQTEQTPQAINPDGYVRAIPVGAMYSGIKKVNSPAEAAHVAYPLVSKAQEALIGIVTDKAGKVLGVIQHTTGTIDQSLAVPRDMLGVVRDINGAANIWLAHNHPSADPALSSADEKTAARFEEVSEGSGISVKGILAVGMGKGAAWWGDGERITVPQSTIDGMGDRKHKIATFDRELTSVADGPRITEPSVLAAFVRDNIGDKDGVLILNTKMIPSAFVPMSFDEMAKLKTGKIDSGSSAIMHGLHKGNGSSMVAVGWGIKSRRDAVQNISNFGSILGARVVDAVDFESGPSFAESGIMPTVGGVFYQRKKDQDRGYFRFSPQMAEREIGLLQNADLSTFVHELSHSWLEELKADAARSDAPDQLKQDWETVKAWLKSDGALTVEQHEQFARGGERYLMEGKAPSAELQGVFNRLQAWLKRIYQTLSGLNVSLNDDVRGVFDRLIASEEEITAARQGQKLVEIFATKEDANMTDAEFAAYRKSAEAAHLAEVQKLQQKLIREGQREHEEWWKAARATMRGEVLAEAEALPVYRAIRLLSTGKMFDGSEGPAMKLDKAAIVRMYGEPFLKRLPKAFGTIYAKDGGVHPDEVASLFGYSSGEAMLKDMAETLPIRQFVDAETDMRMRETYGDMMLDGTIADEAMVEIHNELRADVLRAELKAIAKHKRMAAPAVKNAVSESESQQQKEREYELRWMDAERKLAVAIERGAKQAEIDQLKAESAALKQQERQAKKEMQDSIPPNDAFKLAAAQIINGKKIGEIDPKAYLAAERRAANDTIKAVAKKDWDAAGAAKRSQLLNYHLYREALKSQEQVDHMFKLFDKLKKSDEKLAKGRNVDLINAARAILSKFGIDRNGMNAAEYMLQVQANSPEVFGDLMAAVDAASTEAKPWNKLTMEELNGVYDAVSNLWNLSRRERQFELDGKEMDRDEVIDILAGRLDELGLPKNEAGKKKAVTSMQKFAKGLSGVKAAATRVEAFVNALDGNKPGVFRKFIWEPVVEAINTYRVAKRDYISRYLNMVKIIEPTMTHDNIEANEIGYTFAGKGELLGALLHTGNQSNLEKLLVGREWGFIAEDGGIDTTYWDRFISRMWAEGKITKADYDFIQGVWDLMAELKPAAQKAHHDMYGYYFSEITTDSFMTPWGEYAGGYAPAITDSEIVNDQELRQEKEALESAGNSFMFPSTGRGFTKSRVKYNKPLTLDLRLVPSHIDKSLRFAYVEPRVKDVGRVVMSPDFRDVMEQFSPGSVSDMITPWLQRAARQTIETPSTGKAGRVGDKFFRALRTNTGLQTMVGNVANALQQFSGLFLSSVKVNKKNLAAATVRYAMGPMAMSKEVAAHSDMMKTRVMQSAYDMQAQAEDILLNPNKYEQFRDVSIKHGYLLQQITQHTVDVIIWSAAYDQAVGDGQNERDAVRAADSAVRMTQGSFNAEDLSRIETGSPFVRAFTQFYTYFNMQANLLGSVGAGTVREKGWSGAMPTFFNMYAMFAFAAIVSELISIAARGIDPDDDEIDVLMQLLVWSQVKTAGSFIPYGGSIVNGALAFGNKKRYDDRMSVGPFVSMLESMQRTFVTYPAQAIRGEDIDERRMWRDIFNSAGMATGLPLGLVGRPVGYVAGMNENRYQPANGLDMARGLITGNASKN